MWDCKQGEEIGTYDCKQLPQDLHWNYNGSLFCVSTKDKMDRIFDPRQNIVVQEWSPHDGTKCSKMVWIGDTQHIVTTGFSRTSQREWKMWDLRNLAKPICHDQLDMVRLFSCDDEGFWRAASFLRPRHVHSLPGRSRRR